MAIENLFEMKKEPGVVIVGKDNFNAEEVFDDISKKLADFYGEKGFLFDKRGLVFVSKLFNGRQTRYHCPVYVNEVPDMESRYPIMEDGDRAVVVVEKEKPIKHATIKIERFNEKKRVEWVKNWDFDHEPFRATQQVFGVYFNLKDREKAYRERDYFIKNA